MIAEGKYLAKAIGGKYGVSSEKKTPGVAVTVEFTYENKPHQLTWRGWFSEKTSERTIEALAIMGFDESKAVGQEGFGREHFDGSEFEIVVEHESFVGQDGTQKVSPKVKWVNRVGGSSFGFADNVEVKSVLAGIDLKKEMLVARQKLGLKKQVKNHAPTLADEEIPF